MATISEYMSGNIWKPAAPGPSDASNGTWRSISCSVSKNNLRVTRPSFGFIIFDSQILLYVLGNTTAIKVLH